jgi:ABC-type glutathione transport system ATPase component
MASTPLLCTNKLCVQADTTPLLSDCSFAIAPGERVAVLGRSGSGKTTLALALMGLLREPLRVVSGEVRWDDLPLSATTRHPLRGRGLFLVFQGAGAWLDPLLTIGRQLAQAASRAGVPAALRDSAVANALRSVQLEPAVRQRHAHQLSGGMKQRVLIAMALLLKPRLLIADEPTASLDDDTASEVMAALDVARARLDSALLLVTHDLRQARACTDRVLVLDAGRVVEDTPMAAFAAAPRSAAGRALREAAARLQGVPP